MQTAVTVSHFQKAVLRIGNYLIILAVAMVAVIVGFALYRGVAYDNVIHRDQPEAWNMRVVLGIATVLGLVGPIAAFGLFFLGDRVLHIDRPQIQTMMYLLLSVAGHLTIFQTRTRGPWWSILAARILLAAVVGTQVLATMICVFGFLVAPLWWGWTAMVWVYALAWFLVTDPAELLAYHILDPGAGGGQIVSVDDPNPVFQGQTVRAAQ